MNKEKVSICMLTIDRYQMTKLTLEAILPISEHNNYELLVLDNGSKDKRVIDYVGRFADVHIVEDENIGVAKGFNKLFRKATGDYICLIGNDILLKKDWLKDLLYYNKKIQKSGISAIYCEGEKGNLVEIDKTIVYQRPSNTIDGVTLFNKRMLTIVGGFDESFGLYGFEDNNWAYRASMLGFYNYYIPNQSGTHIGADLNHESVYRANKNKAIELSSKKYIESVNEMRKTMNFNIPL